MDRRERAQLARVVGCLGELASLKPPNPANVAAVVGNLAIATAAASELRGALPYLANGELREASERIGAAEKLLSRDGVQ
jgi:hypothetical protein